MSNINDNSLANLKHFEGKWRHGATKTIRVPIALADEVMAYARRLDSSESHSDHATESLDTSEIDAADLLNQLKAKNKKSKATLSDVEAILELLGH